MHTEDYFSRESIQIDSSSKWQDLNLQSLIDVYAVHKCHRFTFQQMDDYPLSEFIENVVQSNNSIFGNIGISEFVESQEFIDRANRLSLFPSWIIDDDIFSTIRIIYGVTDFAQNMKQNRCTSSGLTIRTYIIPQSVRSLYDQSYVFDVDIPTLADSLKQKGVDQRGQMLITAPSCSAGDIGKAIQELYDQIRTDDAQNIVAVFDRRINSKTVVCELLLFECADWESFDELRRNNLIGFDLDIGADDVSRAYLNYGIRQRIRFYPEFMVSVFAKLFVTPSTMSEYEYLQKLYSAEYKKGWNLNLDDQRFNDIYKAITGTTHETNNYYRANGGDGEKEQKFGFFRFVQRRFVDKHMDALSLLIAYWKHYHYDSDTVIEDILDQNTENEQESNIELLMKAIGRRESLTLKHAALDWKQIECSAENVFNITDCAYIQRLINNLKRYKDCNYIMNTMNMKQFNLDQIIGDFDHLIAVHNMFIGDDPIHIQRYIAIQIDCGRSNDCAVVKQFRDRRRRNEKHSECNRNDNVSPECAVLRETLCEIHCYLLHRTNELYRLSSEKEQAQTKFTSLVKGNDFNNDQKDDEKEEEPLSIDFGVPVIRWLRFGEEPLFETLRDEMVYNKDSSVSDEGYEQMEIVCTEKIKSIKSKQFSDYNLDELMAFKFYTDYTTDCTNLRKAHWKSMPKKVKKRYYHWARTLYRAALRHAIPIPIQNANHGEAKVLFHGLTRLFRMDNESPTYWGPFSTTLTRHVADSFSKQQGLRLQIRSQYQDSMRRCLGIDMRSISGHPNEQEILLVDQPIPIQSATTWESKDDVQINHFLYSLKTRSTEIRDRKEFYKKLGVKYKKKWIAFIMKHGLLNVQSDFQNKSVFHRLVIELGILEVFYRSKYFSSKFIDLIGVNENGYISLNIDPSDSDRFIVWDPVQSKYVAMLNVYEFVVKNVTTGIPEELRYPKNYRFSKFNDFKISIQKSHDCIATNQSCQF